MAAIAPYLPSIIAAVAGALSAFSPQIQNAISSHPSVAGVLAGLYAIFAHFMPSPKA